MIGFLGDPPVTDGVNRMFEEDQADLGYVMNVSRLWAYRPDTLAAFSDLLSGPASGLSYRERGILVVACASALEDSACSLAWGVRLAQASDAETASGVVRGDDDRLSPAERALAAWARKVARDANGISAADVQELRDAGFEDAQIFAITVFVAFRIAFSTVNDALGVQPDAAYYEKAPKELLDAVTFGRPIEEVTG